MARSVFIPQVPNTRGSGGGRGAEGEKGAEETGARALQEWRRGRRRGSRAQHRGENTAATEQEVSLERTKRPSLYQGQKLQMLTRSARLEEMRGEGQRQGKPPHRIPHTSPSPVSDQSCSD